MTRTDPSPRFNQVTFICGFAGAVIILLGAIISGLPYEGRTGALSFFSLLYLVEPIVPEDQPDMPLSQALEALLWNRPAVWQTAIVEWVVVLAALAWLISVSLHLRQATAKPT
jgi:hypothetical protein